ncbi:MOSC domain-containing protein [Blastopirellula sp. J2-11]|uniref:MOSC domain-containing protein n=1 Tax=Blastopirellula sp. J2-11 TaxID=2943192 RepID=UPI0021C8C8BA|nr:MOSC domain-containing protein [Blastopirellula sp. J2-11]UUO05191.1 MOSC domain-containing protein [Blastopirellula sp. J2-11]
MNATGRVIAVCTSTSGGIPRYSVATIELTQQGIVGDKHRYLEHETNERAVSLFDVELYDQLTIDDEPAPPGSVGENITVAGIRLGQLVEGAEVQLGEVIVRLTRRWAPCYAQHPLTGKTRPNREKLTGWFAMVIQAGEVAAHDMVTLSTNSSQNH